MPEKIQSIISQAVEQCSSFGELLSSAEKQRLIDSGAVLSIGPGEYICHQGDTDRHVFIIIMGEVDVVEGEPGSEVLLAKLRRGELFGELSALFATPRMTSIRAAMQSVVLQVPGDDFEQLITGRDELFNAILLRYRHRVTETALRSTRLFRFLPPRALDKLIEQAEIVSIPAGGVIVQEGEQGDGFYVVIHGRARVSHELGDSSINLAVAAAGDYFGEWALLTGAPRAATVTAMTRVDVIRIGKVSFLELIQQHPEVRNEIDRVAHNRYSSINRFAVPDSQQQVNEMLNLIESVFQDDESR